MNLPGYDGPITMHPPPRIPVPWPPAVLDDTFSAELQYLEMRDMVQGTVVHPDKQDVSLFQPNWCRVLRAVTNYA